MVPRNHLLVRCPGLSLKLIKYVRSLKENHKKTELGSFWLSLHVCNIFKKTWFHNEFLKSGTPGDLRVYGTHRSPE